MGCACLKPEIVTFVPFPHTLEDFVMFGEANTVRCLEHLKTIAVTEVRVKAGVNQLMGPYLIQGRKGTGVPDKVVTEPAMEALQVLKEYTARRSARKVEAEERRKGYKVADHSVYDTELERRVRCLLFTVGPIFRDARLAFVGPVDSKRIDRTLRLPLPANKLAALVRLFGRLNDTKTGYLTLNQFAEHISETSQTVTESVFFPLVTKLIDCKREWLMTVEEFVMVVHNLCIMNEEEVLRHVFNSMAEGRDAHGERFVDLTNLKTRYPSLQNAKSNQNLENQSFLKECAVLYQFRAKTWDAGVFERQGHMARFDDFCSMKRRSNYIMYSVAFTRTTYRNMLFGEKWWNKRSHDLRMREGHKKQDETRRGSVAMEMFETLRVNTALGAAVRLPYRVKPLSINDLRTQQFTKAGHDYRRKQSETYTVKNTRVAKSSRKQSQSLTRKLVSNRRASAPSERAARSMRSGQSTATAAAELRRSSALARARNANALDEAHTGVGRSRKFGGSGSGGMGTPVGAAAAAAASGRASVESVPIDDDE